MPTENIGKIRTCIALQRLVMEVFPEVISLVYMPADGEEWVQIGYNAQYTGEDGLIQESKKIMNVNVSCDSNAAIVDDVWKECKRRFG